MYPRCATARIDAALADPRVVYSGGPRQSGKTTLARALNSATRPFFMLDELGGGPMDRASWTRPGAGQKGAPENRSERAGR